LKISARGVMGVAVTRPAVAVVRTRKNEYCMLLRSVLWIYAE
jgi:hypothetical protein